MLSRRIKVIGVMLVSQTTVNETRTAGMTHLPAENYSHCGFAQYKLNEKQCYTDFHTISPAGTLMSSRARSVKCNFAADTAL